MSVEVLPEMQPDSTVKMWLEEAVMKVLNMASSFLRTSGSCSRTAAAAVVAAAVDRDIGRCTWGLRCWGA